jgi:glucose/arabinose dehydrogenase
MNLGFPFALLALVSVASAQVVTSQKEKFKIETVAEGLSNPWALADLGDGRMLVTERLGRLRVIQDGKLLPESVTGIPPVYAVGQGGLLDIELHPDYKNNGWIYLAYSEEKNGGGLTKIIRGRLKDMVFVDQETIFEAPVEDYVSGGNHFGGRIQFDGKGYIFFSIGDRGDVTTPANNAQKLTNVKGKIHRLRDDGGLPRDNPFLSTPGARPSIWSYGHRNPQGLRFDPETGILWETEHGPKGGDELNIISKGKNYGWPVITYGINYNGTPITDHTSQEGMEQPITYWTPSIAVSGLDIYHGKLFPAWKGNLFAAALAHKKLVRIELDEHNGVKSQEMLLEGSGRIRDVRNFADGSIYVIYDDPGKVIRLTPAE